MVKRLTPEEAIQYDFEEKIAAAETDEDRDALKEGLKQALDRQREREEGYENALRMAEERRLAAEALASSIQNDSAKREEVQRAFDAAKTAAMQARVDARHARMREISVELREIRRRTGLTQEQMALAVGKHRVKIAEAETDPSMGIDSMEALIDAYKTVESMRPKATPRKASAES